MKTTQIKWTNGAWELPKQSLPAATLCLVFGSRPTIEANPGYYSSLKALFPQANIVTTSTAGNIVDEHLLDDTILATAIEFKNTTVKCAMFELNTTPDVETGEQVAHYFNAAGFASLLLFSCSGINAGKLLSGINGVLKGAVPVSGGVAGDDTRFEKTLVGLDGNLSSGHLVAIGFYGSHLQVSHGSKGGWDTFGPRRKVTRCKGNILFEVDNKPVLDLYKEYLGDKAAELPGSALLFPFAIINTESSEQIVRGVQNIDESRKALILYGDVEEGDTIQLMRCDFDRLIDGAADSARESFLKSPESPDLAILISCVARRLVLGQLTEEELAETKKVFGSNTAICGFYSYSELSPVVGDNACHLHNQTMTITTFRETAA